MRDQRCGASLFFMAGCAEDISMVSFFFELQITGGPPGISGSYQRLSMASDSESPYTAAETRFDAILISVSIIMFRSDADVVKGAIKILADILPGALAGRATMSTRDVIRVMADEYGPLKALQIFSADGKKVGIPILQDVTWSSGAASAQREKLLINVAQSVMVMCDVLSEDIVPCLMIPRNRLFREIREQLNIEVPPTPNAT